MANQEQLLNIKRQLDMIQDQANELQRQSAPVEQPQKQLSNEELINKILKPYLDQLAKMGQMINPNIPITKEHAAEFLASAQRDVEPYYSSQLKVARQSLLSSLGFSKEETLAKEKNLERQYGLDVRKLSEQAAEIGFTFSGRRQEVERQLAEQAQADIESGRRSLGYGSEQLASAYGLKYGGANIPQETISQAPRALPGETSFARSGTNQPLYQL